jgi:hypothetical protein
MAMLRQPLKQTQTTKKQGPASALLRQDRNFRAMKPTVQNRKKKLKRQEKQIANTTLQRDDIVARRAQQHRGKAKAGASTMAKKVTDAGGHDLENPT